jgi:hypothetical protein
MGGVRRSIAVMFACAACSPGAGRDPIFTDAAVRDATPVDATPVPDVGVPDAGIRDGTVVLPDAGPQPSYPFTGVYGILNADDSLYAREVGGLINIVIGDFPYEYSGTIDEAGNVSTTSPELSRSGCAIARIAGTYDRVAAMYTLLHETCNAVGDPIASRISGGFLANFSPEFSGVFELVAEVVLNPNGCWEGPISNNPVRFAVNYLASGAIAVFTANDLVAEPAWYRGTAGNDGTFSAIHRVDAMGSVQTAMSGRFEQATANDPLRLIGTRDVYDTVKGCGFSITFDGTRVELP